MASRRVEHVLLGTGSKVVGLEGGDFDGISGVAWSRLRQDGGSNNNNDPYHSACLSLET